MKKFRITYTGNSTGWKNTDEFIFARSAREAVEGFYQTFLDYNYFPQDDGTIHDVAGNVIASPDPFYDDKIEYDGGHFIAQEVTNFINLVTDEIIDLWPSTDHPDSSYGLPVWVDREGNSYGQCDLWPCPFGFKPINSLP